jgi:hypothetical protein
VQEPGHLAHGLAQARAVDRPSAPGAGHAQGRTAAETAEAYRKDDGTWQFDL